MLMRHVLVREETLVSRTRTSVQASSCPFQELTSPETKRLWGSDAELFATEEAERLDGKDVA